MPPAGLTKDAGWQVGVRRTFPIHLKDAWELVTSEAGICAWLGDLPGFKPGICAAYQLADGTQGKITIFKPGSHMRLTWFLPGYPRPSIVQVRVIPGGEKTVIVFHQEHLPDAKAREARKVFFDQALADLSNLIAGK